MFLFSVLCVVYSKYTSVYFKYTSTCDLKSYSEHHSMNCIWNLLRKKTSISFTKDVIEFGRLLLNKLWNDLIRKRMCPVTLTWDLKQDFLQIRTHNEDWDASRFHWIKSIESNNIETLWFTRAISGLGQSHFLVNGTIKEHLPTSKQRYPESAAHTEEIEESVYADGLITGDATIENVQKV